MRKVFVILFLLISGLTAFSQKDSTAKKNVKKDWTKISLANRANDHFMMQIGYDGWAGTPDSVHTKGFSRSFNFYFMFDFPFKTDPRWSIGLGLGIGSSNIFFDKQEVLVASLNPTLGFPDLTSANHFKKYKLVTTYLEAPVELRYAIDPENTNGSWKFAIGAKVGTMLSAYTKGKNLLDNNNQLINNYIEKQSSKRYFNNPKLAGTARISKGFFGIYGQFQVNSLIKAAYGPQVYPFTIGITISGL